MTISPETLTILNRSINLDLKLVDKINPTLHLLLRPDAVPVLLINGFLPNLETVVSTVQNGPPDMGITVVRTECPANDGQYEASRTLDRP